MSETCTQCNAKIDKNIKLLYDKKFCSEKCLKVWIDAQATKETICPECRAYVDAVYNIGREKKCFRCMYGEEMLLLIEDKKHDNSVCPRCKRDTNNLYEFEVLKDVYKRRIVLCRKCVLKMVKTQCAMSVAVQT